MNWTKILKALIFIGTISLLYLPFMVSEEMIFLYITGKAYYFRLVTGLIFTAYLILAITDPEYRPKRSLISYSFLLFVISLFFSNLFGINHTNSFWSNYERMEGWITIVHLFLLFIALANTLNKTSWHWIFNLSLIFNSWMLKESFQSILEEGWGYRIEMSLGNSTYLAVYALFNAFLALYLMFNYFAEKDFKAKKVSHFFDNIFKSWAFWFYSIFFVLNSMIIFQTQTRGTVLGWFGGLLLIGLILVFRSRNKVFKIASGALIVTATMALGSIFFFKNTEFVQHNPALNRIASISINEGTAKARILNWQIAAEGVAERPILGWGQSNFNYVFDKYYLPEHYGNENWFDRVHNIFFDWLIAGGIFGLAFYLAIWVGLLWGIFKTTQIKDPAKAVLVGLLAAYFFHNLFVFDQIVSYLYFVFLLAFAHSLYNKDLPSFALKSHQGVQLSLVAIVLIISPIIIWRLNMPSFYANIELLNASRILENKSDGTVGFVYEDGLAHNLALLQKAIGRNTFANSEIRGKALAMINTIARIKNIDPELKQAYLKFVETELLKDIEADPYNSRQYYLLGNFYLQVSQFDSAEEMLLKAIELSPKKPVLKLVLLEVYKESEQAEKAVELAFEIHSNNPDNYSLWFEYIKALARFDQEALKQEIQNQIDLGNYSWPEQFYLDRVQNELTEPQPLFSLAAFYLMIGDTAKATSTLADAILKFPEGKIKIDTLIKQIENGENPLGKTY